MRGLGLHFSYIIIIEPALTIRGEMEEVFMELTVTFAEYGCDGVELYCLHNLDDPDGYEAAS